MKRIGEENQDSDLAADSFSQTGKRKRILNPLNDDVIRSIIERLPPLDLVRTKSISTYWNSFVETLDSHSRFVKSPWLILPPKKGGATSCRFMNLEQNTVHNLNKKTSDMFLRFQCVVGSSREWLIFWNKKTSTPLFLFNSLTLRRIRLPPLHKSFFKESFIQKLSACIRRAILTGDPNSDRYGVLIICGYYRTKLVYFNNGDTSWTLLRNDSESAKYNDAICFGNALYAIQEDSSIWTWDFKENCLRKIINAPDLRRSIYLRSCYLVEVNREILVVHRYFNNCLDGGTDTKRFLSTCFFDVYKVDLEKGRLSEVESWEDWSLSLGGNQSGAVSSKDMRNCKGNSIYFTKDCFMQGDVSGDMGVYDLKGRKITTVFEFPFGRYSKEFPKPEPCWIVPNQY